MPKIHLVPTRPILVSTLAALALTFTAASLAASSPLMHTGPSAPNAHGATDAQGAQSGHPKQEGEEHESALDQAMQMMQGAEKRLGKALEKKDLAAVLPLVVEMQRAAQAAKVETPPEAEKLSDAKKKAEFVAGFRKQLISLQKALCDLETAVLDGKADDATRLYESVIKPMKKAGHAKYKGD